MIVRRRITVFGGIAVVVGLCIFALTSALSGSSMPSKAKSTTTRAINGPRPGSINIGLRTLTVQDASRTTYNYATGQTSQGRKIGIEIRYLTKAGSGATENLNATIVSRKALPLIVFAPGFRLRPENYTHLLDAWVRAGYLVAAVEFPNTTYPATRAPYSAGLPHGSPEADEYIQSKDVAFGLNQLLHYSSTKRNWLDGLIDTHAIALAGHSDGASVVAALGFNSKDVQSKMTFRAIAALSGGEFPIANQTYRQAVPPIPLLVVQSATDLCNPPYAAVQLYDAIGAPKFFLALKSATHLDAYDGTNVAAFAAVVATTLAFFDSELGIHHSTQSSVLNAGNNPGTSTITNVPKAANIPSPPGTTSCPAD